MDPKLRLLIAAAVTLAPAIAHADPPPPAPRLDVAVGAGLGIVLAQRGPHDDGGINTGLQASVAYLARPRVAVVAEGGLGQADIVCATDVACSQEHLTAVAVLTGGARFYPTRAFYLQGEVGVASSRHQRALVRTEWSKVGVVAAGWRRSRGRTFVGLELRAMLLDGSQVTAGSGMVFLSVGRSW